MGILLLVVFVVIVIALLLFFKKHGPKHRVDKSAWDESERIALETLEQRLKTGDITKEEYKEIKRRIIHKT